MHPRKAWQLLSQSGPRWYYETESPIGDCAHLDHALWRLPGVRFLVHMAPLSPPAVRSPAAYAQILIDNIVAFRANYLTDQPAGTPFPGYGVRLPGIGGWYSYTDFGGLIPNASHHPADTIGDFLSAFTYTPPPGLNFAGYDGWVTSSGHTPTDTQFEIGSGLAHDRPTGGLVGNTIVFYSDTVTADLQGESRTVTAWSGNIVTVDPPFAVAPAAGDHCYFRTDPPPACYRFSTAREDLSAWSASFFDAIDTNWPIGLERPEFLACTTENFAEPDVYWYPFAPGTLKEYLDNDDSSVLTDSLSLTAWVSQYGGDANGDVIALPGAEVPAARSPEAQDRRSLAYGAFIVGLAWTWQLSFVNRMKRTWPKTRFIQYQLHAGNRQSPVRTQPDEVFYHGEPWPPDVGHSHDEYNAILPYLFTTATPMAGTVEAEGVTVSFVVQTGSPFLTVSDWGTDHFDVLRFDGDTATELLRGAEVAITGWSPSTRAVTCNALPDNPNTGDTFHGFVEEPGYIDWEDNDVGWAIWAAWDRFYGHGGTLDERYRQSCISWVREAAQRLCTAWTDRDVSPFVARYAEDHPNGNFLLEDKVMFPDPGFLTQPGIQTRDDWTVMLTDMMLAGVTRSVVFEEHEELESVADSWLEILTGVRAAFNRSRGNLEAIAHHRNRNWRSRRTWRG